MKEIILEEGEVICSKCEGERRISISNEYYSRCGQSTDQPITCPKCHGIGKLDWVSNAMGVDSTNYYCVSNSSVSCSSSTPSVTSQSTLHHKRPKKADPRTEDFSKYAKKIGKYFARKLLPEAKSSEPIIEKLEQT